MKKIIYLLAMVLSAFTSRANHLSSELVLDAYGNTLFTAGLDNQYNNRPDYKFRMAEITPGTHYLQVTAYPAYQYYPNSCGQIIFSGYINIPASSKVSARIDRFGRYKVLNIIPRYPGPIVYNVPPYPPAPYYLPMSDYDFNNLRQAIESKSFESTRMEIAKQVLSQRFVSTEQVMNLMNLLTFESSKLELAKFAYSKTVDKENYFRVNNAFTFESSIQELDDYIRNMG